MKTSERTLENPQEYYKSQGPMTAPGTYAAEFCALPRDIAALCEVVQGVLIHQELAPFCTVSHCPTNSGATRTFVRSRKR
jgi:hypothetical protein